MSSIMRWRARANSSLPGRAAVSPAATTARSNSSGTTPLLPAAILRPSFHRREPDRDDGPLLQAFRGLGDHQEILEEAAHRRHHLTALAELVEQGLGNLRRRRGEQDGVERSFFRPTAV